jgi:DNA-binding IclR family transcriptional regulator
VSEVTDAPTTRASQDGTRIQSVVRAAKLMLFVAENPAGRTAKEAADAFGLALPTTYHLLNTLVAEGLLRKDSRRRYSMGPKVGALSDAFLRDNVVPEWLMRPLEELAKTTGETAYLATWRGGEVRVIATVEGDHAVRVAGVHTGAIGNAHARASGKLMLAFASDEVRTHYLDAHPLEPQTEHTITDRARLEAELEAIRERGYAFDEQELMAGVGCVAAPMIDEGTVIAVLTVSAPIHRFEATREKLVAAVREAAEQALA